MVARNCEDEAQAVGQTIIRATNQFFENTSQLVLNVPCSPAKPCTPARQAGGFTGISMAWVVRGLARLSCERALQLERHLKGIGLSVCLNYTGEADLETLWVVGPSCRRR